MSLTDSDYEKIRRLVYEHSRIDLGQNKRELVAARLAKRLRATGIPGYAEYCRHVESRDGHEELTHLIDAISTNHTFFFRESKHFDFLKETVLPAVTRQDPRRHFRLWSAASSSGEEPYSIAILLDHFFANNPGWNWKVEATDISTKILAKAREGIYPAERLREVPPEWMRTYFQKGINEWEGHFRIKAELRRQVQFTHLNLLQPSYPFSEPFHAIWCRNVMIYFDRPTQEQLVGQLAEKLMPGGWLFIGHSESLTGIRHPFKAVKPAIYQKPF